MPTQTAPNRGYVDDQRVDNWDSPSLYTMAGNIIVASEITPVIDVSRYGFLGGYDAISAGHARLLCTWYEDAAATADVGRRAFTLAGEIGVRAQYRIPNLGPFVRLQWTAQGAGNATHSVNLLGSNRVHPLEFIPINPIIVQWQSGLLNNATSANIYPADYYAGPLHLSSGMGVGWIIQVQMLDSTDNWRQGDTVNTVAGNAVYDLLTPPGAWRLNVYNNTGAQNTYFVGAVHSLTGSS